MRGLRNLVFIGGCVAALAQTPGLRFETASIRPAGGPQAQDEANPSFRAYREGKASSFCMVCVSGTHYDNYGMPLKQLIADAYHVDPRLVTGPAWINDPTITFAVHAIMPEGATRAQTPEMMKALLQERFHLETHPATVEQAGYALVTAKNGPKLKAAREMNRSECPQWTESIPVDGKTNLMCRIPGEESIVLMTNSHFGPVRRAMSRTETGLETHAEYFRISMPLLAEEIGNLLSTIWIGPARAGAIVRVENRTAIAGEWDVAIDSEFGDGALPSVTGSLERQGLRLEKIMVPAETVVVDRVDRTPTDN